MCVGDSYTEENVLVPPVPKTYVAIDLKSFYASVECVERGLDSLTTNLVVADASRTDKTICLFLPRCEKEWRCLYYCHGWY